MGCAVSAISNKCACVLVDGTGGGRWLYVLKMSLCFIDNFRVTIFQLLQRNQYRILFVIHKEFLGKFFRTVAKLLS